MIRRAATPRPPAVTPAVQKAMDERRNYQRQRGALENRSLLRGLILLVLLVVVFALFRALGSGYFFSGWYRRW